MNREEEERLLLSAWDKIRSWVRSNCSFSGTEKFNIASTPFHWCKLEVFPSGECAASIGSWGNPGEHRPHLLYGHDSFHFSMGDYAASWSGEEEKLNSYRKGDTSVMYRRGEILYDLLKLLFSNWQSVKGKINAKIAEYNALKNFEP